MAEVKLEQHHSLRFVCVSLHTKEEPEDFPVHMVTVKSEDEDLSFVVHQNLTEEKREDTNTCEEEVETETGYSSCHEQQLKTEESEATIEPKQDFLLVRSESPHFKEEPEEFPFHIITVKTEDDEGDEEHASVIHQRLTEEKREETKGEQCGAEPGCSSDPLTQFHSDREEQTDSSDTDHSEDYSQEQTPPKRSYAMIPPDSSVMDHKPFICSLCEKGFFSKSALSQHQRCAHHRCPIYSKHFPNRNRFSKHLMTHTKERTLDQSSALIRDSVKLISYSDKKLFSCSQRWKSFKRNRDLKVHKLVHTGKRPHQCSICQKTFTQKGSLCEHMRTHTGKKPYKCLFCEKSFAKKTVLDQHQRLCSDQNSLKGHDMEKYRCPECGKSFSSNYHLNRHRKIHIPVTSVETVCSICENVFKYKCDFYRHLNQVHHTCPVCEAAFSNEINLNEHLKTHVKEKSQDLSFISNKTDRCSDCGKNLQSNSHLWLYILGYTGEKPHKCSVCGKCFGFKHDLPQHLQHVHHMCPVCQVFFADEKELNAHQTTHEMTKRHTCSDCGKRFRLKSTLKTHMKIHTGEKPYRCSVCGIGFAVNGNLKRHLKTHTRQKPAVYTVCKKDLKAEK